MKKKKKRHSKKTIVETPKPQVTTAQEPILEEITPQVTNSQEVTSRKTTSQVPTQRVSTTKPVSKLLPKKKRKGFDWYTSLRQVKSFIALISPVEKSIIITLFLMICVLISILQIHLRGKETEIMLEMNFTPEITEFDIPPEEDKVAEGITEQTKITLNAYNEADKALKHADEPFKTLDEILAEREQKEVSESLLMDKNPDVVLPTDIGIEQVQHSAKRQEEVNKNTLVKYALVDRVVRGDLPNPVFTCEEEGKVVVNIKVSEDGKVVSASINQEHSTTKNGCLIDNALAYALQARFNVYLGRKIQNGTITYFFQSKR